MVLFPIAGEGSGTPDLIGSFIPSVDLRRDDSFFRRVSIEGKNGLYAVFAEAEIDAHGA
jgi:hypothetical protein